MYTRNEAISIMNQLGNKRVPFLFLVDFEMKNIRIFPLDQTFPPYIQFEFPDCKKSNGSNQPIEHFFFRKHPLEYETYLKAFQFIRDKIQSGYTFLVNLTFPTIIETNLSLEEIFHHCSAKYKILCDNEFICFSPETFVKIYNGQITACPMKGTINSAIRNAEKEIISDKKELAEHSTIVDLLRNDISQFSLNVHVKRFRYIESIGTHEGGLLQVSSEICGTLTDNYQNALGDILFSLLPAGSVTGAPKRETIEIIRMAEKRDRGYYTGVCGIFDGTNLDSAVLIRFIENYKGRLHFRSGGGITFLSDAYKEYMELIDKVYVPITGNHKSTL